MELDKDLRIKIIETARDVKHICERLSEGRETFKEHRETFEKHDKRIRILEQNQQLLTGKMAIIIIGIGAAVLGTVHILIWVLEKVMGR